ncbi:hypothetical protein [Clostridium saccharoperbutylacetonicum]|uniref:hypothetical protein n=1 Tax=Clostridium saccharoperbutylacetonicum TaxID=36745 RepID=UPI0039EA6D21
MTDNDLAEIRKKIIDIKNNIVLLNPDYSKLDSKINLMLSEMEYFLPKDKKYFCRELDQLYSLQEGISDEIIYMHVLKTFSDK